MPLCPRPNNREIASPYAATSRDNGTIDNREFQIEIRADSVKVRYAVIFVIKAYLDCSNPGHCRHRRSKLKCLLLAVTP